MKRLRLASIPRLVENAVSLAGRVRESIPRHQVGELPAQYGFRSDITYYTLHGDVFAWACAILGLGAVGGSARQLLGHFARRKVHNQVRS